ncbi:MAG: hypothetical protein A2X52_00980 [Candidatus Rokubacteria bacterium GWC2_70_16]|nr:MAG: hypothetical protein A2X52_00980 [Candidatus Rokubacteria bacterium GWC2_70_16]
MRPITRHHHERWHGTGDPDGLRGEAIPPAARIMSVLDVYDALRTARPYKTAMPHQQAVGILKRETDAGSWDPRVVSLFVALRSVNGKGTRTMSPR